MPYTHYNYLQPNPTNTGTQLCDNTRLNQQAIRDAIFAGYMPGWSMRTSGPNPAEPDSILYVGQEGIGPEQVRVDLVWGTTGGADGNVIQADMVYSSDNGVNFDPVSTWFIAYDQDGNVTAIDSTLN